MTPKERQIRKLLRDDFRHYARKCLRVKAKEGQIVPLILNSAQEYLHDRLETQLRETGMVRAMVLKGRQQGISTYTEGRFYWKVTHRKGVRAFILTHEDNATANLFEMTERYHNNCPAIVRPSTTTANAKELYFDKLDSGYKVGTAGTKAVGRSNTIQYFHGSEAAFWPHADSHFAGVMQAIALAPGTEVILESTANGVGGRFYDMWVDAVQGKGDYEAIFIPWFWQAEYTRDPTGFEFTPDERELQKLYDLTDGQLAWRQSKILELKSEDLFRQEYPCTWQEAFISSGRSVFDPLYIEKAVRECFKPNYRARLSGSRVVKRDDGELRVWEDPIPGTRYVIGADVAEGLLHGDYSVADVLKVPNGEQVAQWHGHIDPDLFGDVLEHLGRHYNKAFIGVERNNHGLTTLTTLIRSGYPNLYAQYDIEHRSGEKQTRKIGWLTTKKSKIKILDELAAELRDEQHGIVCRETLDEMRNYQIDEDGSYGAKPGCHDDRVMARAIAGEMLKHAPKNRLQQDTFWGDT